MIKIINNTSLNKVRTKNNKDCAVFYFQFKSCPILMPQKHLESNYKSCVSETGNMYATSRQVREYLMYGKFSHAPNGPPEKVMSKNKRKNW